MKEDKYEDKKVRLLIRDHVFKNRKFVKGKELKFKTKAVYQWMKLMLVEDLMIP